MDYRIRFENDPNATAPAQRVFIHHQLDDDLDIRTFRIGDFGFGDFTREVTNSRTILQVGFIMCYCIVYTGVICHASMIYNTQSRQTRFN